MTTAKGLGLYFVGFICALNIAPASPQGSRCIVSREDYAAYSAVFVDPASIGDVGSDTKKYPELVIQQETAVSKEAEQVLIDSPWLKTHGALASIVPDKQTVTAFLAREKSSCLLRRGFDSELQYELTSKQDIQHLLGKNPTEAWTVFRKSYPRARGYWELSPVGFNAEADEALLYAGNYCGSLCGTGELILLRREGSHWVVKSHWAEWFI